MGERFVSKAVGDNGVMGSEEGGYFWDGYR